MAEDKRPRVSGRRIRVMHVLPNGDLGGGQETVRHLARHLDPERFEVSVVCPDSPMMQRLASIPWVRRFSLQFPTIPGLRTVRRLAPLIRTERVDILHTHLFHGDLYGFLATRLVPVPVLVSTVQGINFFWEMEAFPRRARWWISSRFYRGIYRAFDGIVACSAAVRDAICSRPGLKVHRERVRVIHNSIDVHETLEAAEKLARPTGFSPGSRTSPPKRLITVANFAPFKGHRVLLEALQQLSSEVLFEVLLVGDGPERPALEAMVKSLGLADRVRFLGYRDDVPALLRQCDIFVLPSLWEPFGIAVLEAMTFGVPVVACAAGGIPEIITDGETGTLVAPQDPTALAAGIRRALSDSFFPTQMIPRARKLVESQFDARGMAARYAGWYEELIASTAQGQLPALSGPEDTVQHECSPDY